MFETVAIVGVGLIGGSMGIDLRRMGLAGRVVGVGRRQTSLDAALRVGALDRATLDIEEGVGDADLVVLATPIRAYEALVPKAAPALKPRALVTDVASSKVRVIETISSALRGRPDVAYIPTHPMAGGERSGPQAASPGLFEGSVCIVTPLSNTFPETKSRITRLWNALSARVVSMTPQAHDRLVARVSHVPHLAAAALVAMLQDGQAELCGRGLLDTTRIASGDPDLWMDICASNREEIADALRQYIATLEGMAEGLESGNMGDVRAALESAKATRDRLLELRKT